MTKLRIHPDKLADRYEALEAAFDKLQDKKIFPLDEELRSYWAKRIKKGPVSVEG
jgi:hypothetical protein